MTTVFLDSNIYRKFGKIFSKHQEFVRLKDYLDKTNNEFGLLDIVEKEIYDYFEVDVYGQIKNDFTKLKSTLNKNPFIESDLLPDIEKNIEEGLIKAKEQFNIHNFRFKTQEYQSDTLVDFLLANKKLNGKKDNTRDFLIVYSLFVFCEEKREQQVVLVSEDKIFTENKFMQELQSKKEISNLHFFKSIPNFLKEFGPAFDFVNDELVLTTVSNESIKAELQKDIKCFPSYISRYYFKKKEDSVPNIQSLEIGAITVYDYYVTKKLESEDYLIQFSLAVPIKAIYEPEKDVKSLNTYRASKSKPGTYHSEAFDEKNRPIFEHKVLFIYEGIVDKESQKLIDITFIDFFPDHFLWENYKDKSQKNRKTLSSQFLCPDGEEHTFDTDHGFYQHSQYGGGLSWHYRCSKCGMHYDTGEYFD